MTRGLLILTLALTAVEAFGAPQRRGQPPAGPKIVAAPVAVTLRNGQVAVGMAAVKAGAIQPAAGGAGKSAQPAAASATLERMAEPAKPELAAAVFDNTGHSEKVVASILASAGVDDALERAQWREAVGRIETDPRLRVFQLKRVWDAHGHGMLGPRISVDHGWAVPAIKVRAPEATYIIHPVVHGTGFAVGAGQVKALVRQIIQKGHELYSEQNAPSFFGFRYGKEINDHDAERGLPVVASEEWPGQAERARDTRIARAAALAFYGAVSTAVVAVASTWLGIAAGAAFAGLTLAALWNLMTGGRAAEAAKDLVASWRAARAGLPDVAAQLKREAFALHRARPDPLEVLRLHLPPGLGPDRYAVRSDALAAAVRADAGPKVKHVLVGAAHAARVAWRLAGREVPDEGSQRA